MTRLIHVYIPLTLSSTHCLDFIFYIKTGFATFLSSLCVISLISLRHFSHLFASFLSSLCVISLISLPRRFLSLALFCASFVVSLCFFVLRRFLLSPPYPFCSCHVVLRPFPLSLSHNAASASRIDKIIGLSCKRAL